MEGGRVNGKRKRKNPALSVKHAIINTREKERKKTEGKRKKEETKEERETIERLTGGKKKERKKDYNKT